jgi:hypothetical protein
MVCGFVCWRGYAEAALALPCRRTLEFHSAQGDMLVELYGPERRAELYHPAGKLYVAGSANAIRFMPNPFEHRLSELCEHRFREFGFSLSSRGDFALAVPRWLPIFLFMGLASTMLVRVWRRPTDPNKCIRCGYDLRATPERCPECGTPVAAGRA